MSIKQTESQALTLLREYRLATWRKSALGAIPSASHNIMQSCAEQLLFTEKIVNRLRCNKLLGEKLYWIVYASYMTEQQPDSVDEILSEIARKYKAIPRRTYFRLKIRAVKMLDDLLKLN